MTKQPKALALADELEKYVDANTAELAAAELRRLYALNQELQAALKLIANTDPVDAALDPQRAVRIARAAIARAEGRA